MQMVLFVLTVLLTLITVFVVFLYMRSSFELLELVRGDEGLWQRLGCPERVSGRDFSNRYWTISPIGPWLSWVYSGSTSGLQRGIAARLVVTRNMMMTALLLFTATTMVGGVMMLLVLG